MSKLIRFIKDEVIGMENTFFAWCVLGASGMILAMGFYLSLPNLSFHGVATSREVVVNFEFPVEIGNLHVLPGQAVKKGELLVELNQDQLNLKIRELGAVIEKLKAEKAVRDQMNTAVGNSSAPLNADPLAVELRDQEAEFAVLVRQRNSLYVFAEIDGVVGVVNFNRGQRVAAFAPILTIANESPSFVEGYVPEQLQTNLQVGSVVDVSSMTNAAASATGKVVSLGARYVVIPSRLVPEARGIELWGRQVVIELPPKSKFLLAEKVLISPKMISFPTLVDSAASEEKPAASVAPAVLQPAKLPFALAGKTGFEASGAIYLPDLKKYLVASDDTNDEKAPWLFLMSEDGQVGESPLVIPGLDKINDMESISADGGSIYVMGSLSLDGKGELKKSRNLLVRVRRNGLSLSDTKTVNLGAILRARIAASTDPALKEIQAGIDRLDVEGQAVREGQLYVALKEPQLASGESVILRLNGVDQLFQTGNTSAPVEVFRKLSLPDQFGMRQRLSDILFVGRTLYVTTSCKRGNCGAFWSIDDQAEKPTLIQTFSEAAPEGVALDTVKNSFLLTFDLGANGSKVTSIHR